MIAANFQAFQDAARAYKAAVGIVERELRDVITSQRVSIANNITIADADVQKVIDGMTVNIVNLKEKSQAFYDVLSATEAIPQEPI